LLTNQVFILNHRDGRRTEKWSPGRKYRSTPPVRRRTAIGA